MPRFHSDAAPYASVCAGKPFDMRLSLVLAAALLLLGACGQPMRETVANTPKLHGERLNAEVGAIAARVAPGRLGVGLMNLDSGEVWALEADRYFPLDDIAQLIIAAAVLAEVDAGRVTLADPVVLAEKDISAPFSPIAAAWPARTDYTVSQLLNAMVHQGDNTAADVLMRLIGGPGAVTAWLDLNDVEEVRIDRYARELEVEVRDLAPFRIAWKDDAGFAEALGSRPAPDRRAAAQADQRDQRDCATPRGVLTFLNRLEDGELLTPASRRLLLGLIVEGSAPSMLTAGFPAGSKFMHKAANPPSDLGMARATNDVGFVELPDGRRYAVAVLVAGASLDARAREAAVADVARAISRGVR